MKTVVFLAALAWGIAGAADFSYTDRTELTGGAMKQMTSGIMGRMMKDVNRPVISTVAFRGDRMARKSESANTITDVSAGTLTSVDYEKKQYSVITFAEMVEAMQKAAAQMQQKMKDANAQQPAMKMKVSVDDTGKTRTIAGVDTRQFIMKIESQMEATDAKSGQTAQINTTMNNEMWMGKVPGHETVTAYYRRAAEKMAPSTMIPAGALMQAGPEAVKGLQEAGRKLSEMDAMPMLSVIRIMGAGLAGMPPVPPSGGSNTSQAPPQPTSGDAVATAANAALGRFGLGGFGRKKPQQSEPPKPPEAPPAPAASDAPAAPGVLAEFTSEVTSYSSAAVDSSLFEVPAGFKEVEHPMKQFLKKN